MSLLQRLGAIIAVTWFLNFAAFVVIAIRIGGDAMNGHAAGGHYYLADHGTLTEVSRQVFVYSEIHVISVWVLTALVIPLGLIHAWRRRHEHKKR